MAESIGNLYGTQIPSLSDTADIQTALRLYHYGAPPGTGIGQYDPTNTVPANLVNPSIAYTLNSLQTQITTVSGNVGISPSVLTNKGALISASGPSTVSVLSLPSQSTANDGLVLTIQYGTTTGLVWATPPVTLTNTVTLTNKTFTDSTTFFQDDSDNTKKMQFQLSGIGSGLTRTLTIPNTSGTIITSGNLTDITTVGTVTAGTWNGSVIGAIYGGTGQSSYTIGDLLVANTSTTLTKLAGVATGNALISGGVGVAPSYGKIGLTTHITGTLAATNGGTGFASYTIGDILYASGSTTLTALTAVASGNALISNGVGSAPVYGKIGLTTHITGTLAVGNGGTGFATYTSGDLIYASATNTLAKLAIGSNGQVLTLSGGLPSWQNAPSGFANPMTAVGDIIYGSTAGSATRLAPNISSTIAFLSSTGTGSAGQAPIWTTSVGTGSVVLSNSPGFSGTPTAPTAPSGTNNTQIATTAFCYQSEDFIVIALSDETTNITTGTAKLTWRAPFAMTLTQIPRASLATASTSGNPTVDINEAGVSILGANKLSIDVNELTSTTAATPTTLADTSIADDAVITFDIDVAGSGAKGLKVTLYYRRS